MSGGEPAQQRAVAAGQDGGEIAGLERGCAVSHAINPAVLAQQRPRPEPIRDLVAAEASDEQLLTRHHAMRPAREPGQDPLDCPVLCRHMRH
jgi:hypothetical protein